MGLNNVFGTSLSETTETYKHPVEERVRLRCHISFAPKSICEPTAFNQPALTKCSAALPPQMLLTDVVTQEGTVTVIEVMHFLQSHSNGSSASLHFSLMTTQPGSEEGYRMLGKLSS